MSSTILERARSCHEYAERYERGIVNTLNDKPNGQKAKMWQQHKISNMLNTMCAAETELQGIYEDKAGVMKEELESMRGSKMFSSFYEKLKHTNEYEQRFPGMSNEAMDINPEESMEVEVHVAFSGEEIFGKYLDLHSFYVQYCNLPNIPSHDVDYLQYLDKFNSFFYIPENSKSHKAYVQYISSLWEYLLDFFRRVQPLVEVEDLLAEWRAAFEKKWSVGDVSGWAPPRKSGGGDSQALRLGMFNSKDELEALGLDRLKGALEALGLKCGGTLSDRADRLWSVRGVKPNDIPDKLKAKAKRAGSADNSGDSARKKTALLEYLIQSLCSLMAEIVTATRRHAEKQQTRTLEEKLALLEEEEYGTLPDVEEADDDEDDEGPLYNPLNLPLGWDGKPIPFWLYKLHGLGVEFKCEICGNQSYWGRRAFDRHFQEWRHAHGMRCLGVPNTKHFHDITLIEDALALYSKIRDSLKKEQFVEDVEEEFEDSEGNVLNRRTYEDLARQGLL